MTPVLFAGHGFNAWGVLNVDSEQFGPLVVDGSAIDELPNYVRHHIRHVLEVGDSDLVYDVLLPGFFKHDSRLKAEGGRLDVYVRQKRGAVGCDGFNLQHFHIAAEWHCEHMDCEAPADLTGDRYLHVLDNSSRDCRGTVRALVAQVEQGPQRVILDWADVVGIVVPVLDDRKIRLLDERKVALTEDILPRVLRRHRTPSEPVLPPLTFGVEPSVDAAHGINQVVQSSESVKEKVRQQQAPLANRGIGDRTKIEDILAGWSLVITPKSASVVTHPDIETGYEVVQVLLRSPYFESGPSEVGRDHSIPDQSS